MKRSIMLVLAISSVIASTPAYAKPTEDDPCEAAAWLCQKLQPPKGKVCASQSFTLLGKFLGLFRKGCR